MRNITLTNVILFIYEQIVMHEYYKYNYHKSDNNLAIMRNFITGFCFDNNGINFKLYNIRSIIKKIPATPRRVHMHGWYASFVIKELDSIYISSNFQLTHIYFSNFFTKKQRSSFIQIRRVHQSKSLHIQVH
jgi:hypothetical protein